MAAKAKKPAKKAKKAALKIPAELAALVPKAKAAKFDWNAFIQIIIALFNRQPPAPPPPAPVPTPTPVPPTPVPTPVPPVPEPHPMPFPSGCPKPDGIKLGFRQNPTKLKLGYRNEADVTPTIGGVPCDPGCGEFYFNTFGQPEAFQSLEGGFQNDPVERASGNSFGCILRFASNSEGLWKNGKYQEAGKMTVKVTYPWLNFYRAQDVIMGEDGKITGGGPNNQSYDIPK